MKRPKQKYKIGDIVRIVDAKNCTFGFADDMQRYIDREATIKKVLWSEYRREYAYSVDVYMCKWVWCSKCFEPIGVLELPDFEAQYDLNLLFS